MLHNVVALSRRECIYLLCALHIDITTDAPYAQGCICTCYTDPCSPIGGWYSKRLQEQQDCSCTQDCQGANSSHRALPRCKCSTSWHSTAASQGHRTAYSIRDHFNTAGHGLVPTVTHCGPDQSCCTNCWYNIRKIITMCHKHCCHQDMTSDMLMHAELHGYMHAADFHLQIICTMLQVACIIPKAAQGADCSSTHSGSCHRTVYIHCGCNPSEHDVPSNSQRCIMLKPSMLCVCEIRTTVSRGAEQRSSFAKANEPVKLTPVKQFCNMLGWLCVQCHLSMGPVLYLSICCVYMLCIPTALYLCSRLPVCAELCCRKQVSKPDLVIMLSNMLPCAD